jgi:aspartate aminotransferase
MARVSNMAANLIGSEIIKLAGEVKQRIAAGQEIYNFTIGDFDPAVFPIPDELEEAIVEAYRAKHTNYPPADGMQGLREVLSQFIKANLGLQYAAKDYLIAGGARPLIHAVYQALVDPGDKVLFPVPSWNNNHYTHMAHAESVMLETHPENNFMPTAGQLKPLIGDVRMLALCSPLNPTGTVFEPEQLRAICNLVIEENQRRGPENPLYVMYDQIYWTLCYGDARHHDPVSLVPEMREYTIYIDGLSKSFAATGVRVGWAFGPTEIISRMKSILGHIGAWAPKAEQVASETFLLDHSAVENYLAWIREELESRLMAMYKGIRSLADLGYPVDAIHPQGALYLTLRIALKGKVKPDGERITTTPQTTAYLLEAASLAIVPFSAFGADANSDWYRLSVGTATHEHISDALLQLQAALDQLTN